MTGISQSDSLLTIGEAADQAGVALLELREHIRSGRLATVRGQRLGDELPLISMQALVHIYPSAARRRRRPLGTLAERGIVVVGQKGPLESDLGPGGKSTPQGADKRRKPAPVAKQTGQDTAGANGSAEPFDPEVEKLENEVKRLREEVQQAKDRNQDLLVDLDSASAEAQRVLDGARGPALRRRKHRDRSQREQAELDSALDGMGSGRTFSGWFAALASLVVAALLVAWMRNPVHAAQVAPDPPSADADAAREALVVRSLRDGAALERVLAAKRRARQRRANEVMVHPTDTGSNNGVAAQAGFTGDGEANTGGPAGSEALAGVVSNGNGQADDPASSEPGAQQPADRKLTAPVSTGEPCEMFPLTGLGQPLREILGPCLGSWNPAKKSIAGVHRQDGKHWCLHHTVIARDLGGSIVRAKEIAEYAQQDGLVPPLLQLRVDRTAAKFLEARTSTWIESGFESGSDSDHHVSRLVGRDRWRLESWVRLPGKDGSARRRGFRMQVELNGSEWLDRELEFEWLD